MFYHRTTILVQWAVPLIDEPMSARILTSALDEAFGACQNEDLDPERDLHWEVKGWPEAHDEKHLVIEFRKVVSKRIVRQAS